MLTHDSPVERETRRTRAWKLIERRHGKPWWAVLGHLLWIEGLTQAQAATRLGYSRRAVQAWARDERVRNYGAKEPAA